MQNASKIIMVAVAVLGLALVGVLIGRIAGGGSRSPNVVPPQAPQIVENTARTNPAPAPPHFTAPPVKPIRTAPAVAPTNTTKAAIPEIPTSAGIISTNAWEVK